MLASKLNLVTVLTQTVLNTLPPLSRKSCSKSSSFSQYVWVATATACIFRHKIDVVKDTEIDP